MVQLILLILLLFLPHQALATTYYVAPSGGSNSNNGTSTATPFATVRHCVSIMVAGDTCLLRGGQYNEGLVQFKRSGTQSAPIKLLNYPNERPIIRCIDPDQHWVLVQNGSGFNRPVGWLTIEGLEITNCYYGLRFYNIHDSVIRRNWFHHNPNNAGIQGNGTRVLIERNIFQSNASSARPNHGMYANGTAWTVTNNLFIDSYHWGIQLNAGCNNYACYDPARHAGPEFARSDDWIISDNTFAYSFSRGGIVSYGSEQDGTRIENNLFYENCTTCTSSESAAIDFFASAPTNVTVRNNFSYTSGSGGNGFIVRSPSSGVEGVNWTQSGNVISGTPPGFVNGGNNALPASPDFRLTATAPLNIALPNEFLNNPTNVVGAFKTIGAPTCTIVTNVVTCTFPMNTAVPIQVPSTAGWSVSCTPNPTACPATPVISTAERRVGTDTQVNLVINGITDDACAAGQDWRVTYNSATGALSDSAHIGPWPGLHQPVGSFSNVLAVNACTGSGPPAQTVATITYNMDEGTGTQVTDTGGGALHATLVGGAGWGTGKTGTGVVTTGATQQMLIPYGFGVNPSAQSMTWVVPIYIPAGQTGLGNFFFGSETGIDQRGYLGAWQGTFRVARQTLNVANAGASNLVVDAGWNHLCVRWDAATDTVTMYKNGMQGTGGATGSYTSFTFPTNFEAPIIGAGFSAPEVTNTYDNVQIFTSLEDCAALYANWDPPSVPTGDVFSQTAVRFEDVFLPSAGGGPTVLPSPGNAKKVVKGGAVVVVMQIECNGCSESSFRIEGRDNGTGSWLQLPDTPTASNLYTWGDGVHEFLNVGSRSTRIFENGCTVVAGPTLLKSSQIPQLTLPASGCTMLGYIVRVSPTASGFTELRLAKEGGAAFTGTYVLGRIDITDAQAGGVGF